MIWLILVVLFMTTTCSRCTGQSRATRENRSVVKGYVCLGKVLGDSGDRVVGIELVKLSLSLVLFIRGNRAEISLRSDNFKQMLTALS